MTAELEHLKLVMLISLQQMDDATDQIARCVACRRFTHMLERVGEILGNGAVRIHNGPEGRTIEFRGEQ
jgi:hypothetical protein